MRWWWWLIGEVLFFQGYSQSVWDGEGGDGQWGNALNWQTNQVPSGIGKVVLDNSIVGESYIVVLPTGDTAVTLGSLEIIPAAGKTIRLQLSTGSTISPALTATGAGDAIVLHKGAVLENSSGAAAGTPVTVTDSGYFRVNNGGHYIHHTERGHTTGLVSRLSTAAGTEQGIFEFDVPGAGAYTISASNRHYGTLVFSSSGAAITKTYTASGTGPFTIHGDLLIHAGVMLSYGANTNSIIVQRDCIIDSSGTLNLSNGPNNALLQLQGKLLLDGVITESGTSTQTQVQFNGTTNQAISLNGSFTNNINFMINNPAGVTLLSLLQVQHHFNFVQGKVFASLPGAVLFAEGASWSGASGASFVEGMVRKRGDSAFDFPVGTGMLYSPIGIAAGGSITDEFAAAYVRANPQTTPGLGSIVANPVDHISQVEYWQLQQTNGSSERKVRMFVSPYSFAHVLPSLLITRFNQGIWQSVGGVDITAGDPAPPYVTGQLESQQPLQHYGIFALGTSDAITINPLPINNMNLKLQQTFSGIMIKWQLDDEGSGTRMTVQRSSNGKRFTDLGVIESSAFQKQYEFMDEQMEPATTFSYRVKVTRVDGTTTFSEIRRIEHPLPLITSTGMMAIVLHEQSLLVVNSPANAKCKIMVTSLNGGVLSEWVCNIVAGSNIIPIRANGIPRGVYFVVIENKEEWSGIRWVKP